MHVWITLGKDTFCHCSVLVQRLRWELSLLLHIYRSKKHSFYSLIKKNSNKQDLNGLCNKGGGCFESLTYFDLLLFSEHWHDSKSYEAAFPCTFPEPCPCVFLQQILPGLWLQFQERLYCSERYERKVNSNVSWFKVTPLQSCHVKTKKQHVIFCHA